MRLKALSLILLIFCGACRTTRPFKAADGTILDTSIAEMQRVPINGVRQFVTIRGSDRRNPVLLWLHGGPGNLSMPLYMHYNAPLEDHFTVVYWDQRGSGKSYSSRIPAETMTLDQFVADTHALTAWLKQRFNQPKIVLVGHSWGGLLGMHVIAKHPDDYQAFMAVSPISNGPVSEQLSYEFALSNAQQKQDGSALATLQQIGPPENGLYKDGLDALKKQRDLVQKYGGVVHTHLRMPGSQIYLRSKEYSLLSLLKANKIQQLSYPMVETLWPALDLKQQIPAVNVPVYFCLGRYDNNCPSTLVADYVASVQAPHKELIWFEESAHLPCWEEPQKFNALVKEKLATATDKAALK
ncbi:putative aminopeptidase ybaC [Fibrella aestuarina BUZ 2]|uniref:Putative aminopeptidase ybaC n=1 Tax=Fibrella aestuarina BUZ 2 TaxID=1166018 RepID=I0K7R2_9BACT|nr:alpha/beta hydrolase [Fibrella aestuarina]CCH00165.1 putative aminopeptidase ybaC [Fibrella aestuarina BUZ 2]